MSNHDVLNRLDEVEESVRGPGRVLREARKAKQMDQIEVSRYLNLDLSIISGLEQDDYDNLPPSTFTRGYIGSYARYLELDPEQILKEYDRVSSDQPSSLRTELMRNQQAQSSDLWMRIATFGLLVLLIALVAIWWVKRESNGATEQPLVGGLESSSQLLNSHVSSQLDSQDLPDVVDAVVVDTSLKMAVSPPVAELPVAETSVAALTGDDARLGQSQVSIVESADNVGLELNMDNAQLVNNRLDLSQSDEQLGLGMQDEVEVEAVEEAAPTELGLSDGSDLLAMLFTDDCWTSVRDRNGRLLVYRTVKSGSSLNVRGNGPFQVHLGNAPVVTLELNGNNFDFGDKITGRIARFSTR